jgi:putative membrane protein
MHQLYQMETKAGEWARSKGATAQVRAYGDRLVRDHAMADQRILDVAEKQGIPVGEPTPKNAEEEQEMKEQAATLDRLPTLQGREFDQSFLEFMHKGHKSAIKMLCSARGKLAPSTPLPALIETLIPILRQHYQIAIELEMDEIIRGVD